MPKRIFAVLSLSVLICVASTASTQDNNIGDGAKKVGGGFRAIGKSAEEIGAKAGKAAEGAARDTGSTLGSAWDNIVRGLKKAFK